MVTQAETTPYVLSMFTDEGVSSFLLSEHPSVDKEGDYIIVSTSSTEVEVLEDAVHSFSINVADDAITSVDHVVNKGGVMTQEVNMITFDGFVPHSQVTLYSLGGQVVNLYYITNDGTLVISIESLSSGVYIIKTINVTYKIIKK